MAATLEAKQVALDLAGELLQAPAPVRNKWLLDARERWPRRAAQLIVAVNTMTGTPFGLWHDDPVGFVEVALAESLWSGQHAVLESLRDHERTVVPSCHAAGKTHLMTRAVAWFICAHPYGSAMAVTTATSWRQVRNLLWMGPSGINWLWNRAKLPGTCLQTEIQINGGVVAYGFSPKDTDETAFSGIHAQYLIVVVDEAGGLSPVLGQSIESTLSSGHVRLVAIGNPPVDETGSPWMEQRTALKSYNVVRLAAKDTPNFTGERTPACRIHPADAPHDIASHLITPHWADTIKEEEGEDSPYYVARVLAQFPHDYVIKTVPRSWIEAAQKNDEPDTLHQVRVGVDPAADGGDRFAIAIAEGMTVRVAKSIRPKAGITTFELAGYVLEVLEEAEAIRAANGWEAPVRVKIDALGLGMGVSDTLKAWYTEGRHDADVVAVKVSEKCTDDEAQNRYANQRAEMWWLGRQLSQPEEGTGKQAWRLIIGDDVVRQLNAPTYTRNSSGKIVIESKADMSRRRIASPDDAEAILLAVYEPQPATEATFHSPTGYTIPGHGRM